MRNTQKALLAALLEPADRLRQAERAGDYTARLVLTEECKTLPFAGVWADLSELNGVPAGAEWLDEVRRYERTVLADR